MEESQLTKPLSLQPFQDDLKMLKQQGAWG